MCALSRTGRGVTLKSIRERTNGAFDGCRKDRSIPPTPLLGD